jgi:hypothetical protein
LINFYKEPKMNTHFAKRLAQRENVELTSEHKQKLLDFEQGKKLTTKDKLFVIRMCEKYPDMISGIINEQPNLWQKLQTDEPELAEMIKIRLPR